MSFTWVLLRQSFFFVSSTRVIQTDNKSYKAVGGVADEKTTAQNDLHLSM